MAVLPAVIVARLLHDLIVTEISAHAGSFFAPGAVDPLAARPEQAERRRPGGGSQMHQAAVVADVEGAAPQGSRQPRPFHLPDQVDRALCRQAGKGPGGPTPPPAATQ